ncbi:MAG: hypothetical protein U5N27_02005 [Rhizobium sp.]|nr:hypothetical protein [Rhizobium sp.]
MRCNRAGSASPPSASSPPMARRSSEHPLSSGKIYTWRGGDKTRYILPVYTTPNRPAPSRRTETRTDGSGQDGHPDTRHHP